MERIGWDDEGKTVAFADSLRMVKREICSMMGFIGGSTSGCGARNVGVLSEFAGVGSDFDNCCDDDDEDGDGVGRTGGECKASRNAASAAFVVASSRRIASERRF